MALSIGQRAGEVAVAGALAALGGYMIWASTGMPAGSLALPGPGFLPAALGVALIGLGGVLAGMAMLGGQAAPVPEKIRLFGFEVVVGIVALAAVAAAFEPVGVLLTLAAFLAVTIKAFARASWLWAGAVAVALALLALLFFREILGGQLPRGLLY